MPTALQLTGEERQTYIDGLRQRMSLMGKPVSPEEISARDTLLERVKQVAAEIKTRFGARRVILFGSLAHGAWFRPDSDVDLAVEGLRDFSK